MDDRDRFLIPPRRSKPATFGARVLATLYGQFRKPTGVLGWIAGWIMAHRSSNTTRNRWTVDLLNIKETDRVLEIGFGPGLSIAFAARLARQGVVVGIDHSVLMLRTATRRNHAAIEAGRVELKVGELESLPTLGETFDKAFSVNVLQFVEDRRAALHTIRSVLKPGGLMATTYQPRHRGARPEDADAFARQLSTQMHDLGFRNIATEKLDLKPLPAICVLGRK
jgi:ubiquinone/menaquinone biosynthesis C-methylase UbiE